MAPYYAVSNFHKRKKRLDDIQISWNDNENLYCKMLAVFTYADIKCTVHNLAFIQNYEIIQESKETYELAVTQLSGNFKVINIDSIDHMVEMKPRCAYKEQYYICINIIQY